MGNITDFTKTQELFVSKHFELVSDASVWDDLQINLSSAKLPASNSPTWRTHDFGVSGGLAYSVLGFADCHYEIDTIGSATELSK